MKGNTELKMNQATMIDALQLYFDKVLTAEHRMVVTECKLDRSGSYSGGPDQFVVALGDPAETAKA